MGQLGSVGKLGVSRICGKDKEDQQGQAESTGRTRGSGER